MIDGRRLANIAYTRATGPAVAQGDTFLVSLKTRKDCLRDKAAAKKNVDAKEKHPTGDDFFQMRAVDDENSQDVYVDEEFDSQISEGKNLVDEVIVKSKQK